MSFEDAIAAALAPMDGKTLVGSPVLSKRPFEEAVSAFSGVTWDLDLMDDAKSLVLAKAGRIDFVNPEGAPIVYNPDEAGWTNSSMSAISTTTGPAAWIRRCRSW